MKILVLTPDFPYPPHKGTAIRNYHLVRNLAARHDLTLLSFADYPKRTDYGDLGGECAIHLVEAPLRPRVARIADLPLPWRPDLARRLPSPQMVERFRTLVVSHRYDLIVVEALEMAAQLDGFSTGELRSLPATILDEHNAEYVLQHRAFEIDARNPARWHAAAYSFVQSFKLRMYERRACRRVRAVITASESDRQALLRLDRSLHVSVVPNGVDTRHFAMADRGASSPRLVFAGTMDFRPNVDGVLWFCKEIWPRILAQIPEATFWIVGRDPKREVQKLARCPGVTVTGKVPDVRPYLAAAALAVVPLRIGGGSRLKVLEAMAAGAPVVSTTLGCEGLDVTPQAVVLADKPDEFAMRACELLRSRPRRQALACAARYLVERDYDWRVIVPRFEVACEKVMCEGEQI